MLSGASTYNGSTYIGTSATAGAPGDNPDGINTFLNGGSAIAGGVLTVANGQALGANTGGGVVDQSGSTLQLEGNITIAGKSLTVAGTGAPTVGATENWMEQGPAPVLNGQTLATPTVVNAASPVAGRVTGVAIDPTDPNTMYVATAGGGLWKTTNAQSAVGDVSWHPIFDAAPTLFFGTINIDPFDPLRIYASTGYMDNASDSEIGMGMYVSNDGGVTWKPLLNADGSNPMYGLTITSLVFDPGDPASNGGSGCVFYVATSDQAINKPNNYALPGGPPTVGVYRFDATPPAGATRWFNLTNTVSTNRAGGADTAPILPGPDDDYQIDFAQMNDTWSSLAIANGVLFAAQGADQGYPTRPIPNDFNPFTLPAGFHTAANAVFRLPLNQEFYTTAATRGQLTYNLQGADYSPSYAYTNTVWFIGDGGIDFDPLSNTYGQVLNANAGEAANNPPEFPTPIEFHSTADNGYIALTAVATGANVNQQTVYAAVTYPSGNTAWPGYAPDQLYRIMVSVTGGTGWNPVKNEPANYMGNQGDYDSVIYTPDGTNVYIGGLDQFELSPDGGTTWKSLDVDSNSNGPYADFHQITPAPAGGSLFVATDGGLWQLTTATNTWQDFNGNPADNGSLANELVNGVGIVVNNPQQGYDGNQADAIAQFNDSLSWNQVNGNIVANPYGGLVYVDPSNPDTVYSVVTNVAMPGGANGFGTIASLEKTTDANAAVPTWTVIAQSGSQDPEFLIDPLNPQRVVFGGGGALQESFDGGTTWLNTAAPASTVFAIAGYQGVFQADTRFPLVDDLGTNTDDPNTIYASNGASIFVTKDAGNHWVAANLPAAESNLIVDLEVDPRNRDTVYAVRLSTDGKQLWMSTNAGQTWSQVTSAGLPNVIAYKLVINPQTDDLYLGDAQGAYVLYDGAGANPAASWVALGNGLPTNLQVKEMYLNPFLNTLTIGTYGRSTYTMWLNESQLAGGDRTTLSPASGAAVEDLDGTAVWTGAVTLTGPTTFGADGGTAYQRFGNFAGQLNIVGSISDLSTANTITKIGFGNVILSGKDFYAGETDIQQGVLIADNPDALSGSFTLVENNAALQLESSIDNNEPLTLTGNGPAGGFDGHFTGALESIANNNTYTGPITLASNVTIGVDSGSTLTITDQGTNDQGQPDDGEIGEQLFNLNLTKELTGTLILDDTNSYSGSTYVNQGVLQLENSGALAGSPSSYVYVLDGAQLQLASTDGVAASEVKVQNPLSLSGTGITGTGALLNVSGDNTWSGDIVLDANPGFSANTDPAGAVAFGVGVTGNTADAQDILNISGTISEGTAGLDSGLRKVGPDTLVLSGTNTYHGTTYIDTGVVSIQNPKALGAVDNVGHDEIQRLTVYDPAGNGTLSLQFDGQSMASAISATSSQAAWQTAITTLVQKAYTAADSVTVQLNKIPAPLEAGTPTTSFVEFVYTIVFNLPNLVGTLVPQLVALPNGDGEPPPSPPWPKTATGPTSPAARPWTWTWIPPQPAPQRR